MVGGRTDTHHCPGASHGGKGRGSCRDVVGLNNIMYCITHTWQCPQHPECRPMINSPCGNCINKEKMQDKRENPREEHDKLIGGSHKKLKKHYPEDDGKKDKKKNKKKDAK